MSPYYRELRTRIGHGLLLIPSVAAVIRNSAGQLLLQEKSSGEGWSLPAGAIEPGETPDQAIRREVLEETGFVTEHVGILGVFGGETFRYAYPNGDAVEYVVTLYRCRVIGVAEGPLDPETQTIRYFSESEMPRIALPYPMEALFGDD